VAITIATKGRLGAPASPTGTAQGAADAARAATIQS
jgi:hypothetical protein